MKHVWTLILNLNSLNFEWLKRSEVAIVQPTPTAWKKKNFSLRFESIKIKDAFNYIVSEALTWLHAIKTNDLIND